MANTKKQFEEFYENIKLTKNQRDDAKAKYDGVCKKLHDTYYPTITYTGNTKLLIGSYGKQTNIRPARDVDVVFVMPPEKFDQYDDNSSNKQSQLLQDIKSILETKYTNTPISAFGKIVKLEFADTKHNVELVPAWENGDGTFTIPNSENGGSWEACDYRKELSEILDSDTQTGRTKFLIRCIKKWSDQSTVKVSSYKIERTALGFLREKDVSDYSSAFLIKEFFEFFLTIADTDNLRSHLGTALNRAQKAHSFEEEGKISEATDEWKKIFGDDFPSAQIEKSIDLPALVSTLQYKYPSNNEEYLEQKYGISFSVNSSYNVEVQVMINQNGWRSNQWLLSEFQSRGYRIRKGASLIFSVVGNTVPGVYDIKWKVRNFGDEAQRKNDLRGEISDDSGAGQKTENTMYHGEHYVECYVIKDGTCVAVGQVFVPIE